MKCFICSQKQELRLQDGGFTEPVQGQNQDLRFWDKMPEDLGSWNKTSENLGSQDKTSEDMGSWKSDKLTECWINL